MRPTLQAVVTLGALGVAVQAQPVKIPEQPAKKHQAVVKLSKAELASITAGSNANFPPGQFPSGNPAHAPGNSNPNENGGPKK
jgi:hypothetical protein